MCRSSRSRSVALPRRLATVTAIYLALALHLSAISHIVQASDLLIVTENLPPYNYRDGDTIKGVSAEVVQALLKEVGIQANIQVLSWVRAYLQALNKPNVLIFSIVRTPHREELFHWVGQVSTTKSYLFKLASREDIRISSIEDAKPYLIGTWREDVREQYLLSQGFIKQQQLDSSGNPKQNIRKLMVQRLDLVADSELSFSYLVKQLNYDSNLFAKAFKLEAVSLPFYIAFSKQTSLDLVSAFRNVLKRVKRKGIFHAIHQKYLGHANQVPGTNP